jgi:hypothetical protein
VKRHPFPEAFGAALRGLFTGPPPLPLAALRVALINHQPTTNFPLSLSPFTIPASSKLEPIAHLLASFLIQPGPPLRGSAAVRSRCTFRSLLTSGPSQKGRPADLIACLFMATLERGPKTGPFP